MNNVLSIIGIASGIISLIVVIWRIGFKSGSDERDKQEFRRDISKTQLDVAAIFRRIDDVEDLARSAAMKIEPFWEVIKTNLPQLLNVSHSENLVKKLSTNEITDDELIHLEEELKEILIRDRESGNRVFIDLMALWAVNIRKKERGIKDE